MARKGILFAMLVVFVISLSGCATFCKKSNREIQSLKNQVTLLESQAQTKDEEINSLRDQLSRAEAPQEVIQKQIIRKKAIPEAKSRPSIKQIQLALKNAGYASGNLDGKLGRQTKEAIKAFQKANNLPADGKVGKNTWELLKDYLYKKVK